jgi:hypothetical protein
MLKDSEGRARPARRVGLLAKQAGWGTGYTAHSSAPVIGVQLRALQIALEANLPGTRGKVMKCRFV